jgi:hypothetical protein
MFLNQAAFDAPASYQTASGVNLNPNSAVTDSKGNILFGAVLANALLCYRGCHAEEPFEQGEAI